MGRPPGGRRAQPNGNNKNNTNNNTNNDATKDKNDNIVNHNANNGPNSSNNASNTNKNRRRKNTTRGRGRNGSNNNKSNNSSKINKPPPPLQLPHAKITIRKIQNIEKFGSRDKMADFILCLCGVSPSTLSSSNKSIGGDASSNSNAHLIVDEYSLTKCCKDINPQESSSKETNESNLKETELNEATSEGSEGKEQDLSVKENNSNPSPRTTTPLIKAAPHDRNDAVTVRVLYVIPPRKSRRRGIITGVVYLVLYPPDPTKAAVDNTNKNLPNKINTDESSDSNKGNKLETNTSTQAPQPTLLVGQERSKAVAAARLTLQNAQQYLTSQALLHANTLGECQVELSPSQKTWKDLSTQNKTNQNGSKRSERGDRYENTILNTDDYHKFVENLKKEEEERASRPKPLPGGGEIDISTSNNINNNPLLTSGISSDNNSKDDANAKSNYANENMMSALALYLRNKKKEQKAKQIAKQTAKQRNSTSNTSNVSGAVTSSASSKKKKKATSLGSIKLMEKSNNSRKMRLGNHIVSTDRKDETSKATSKSAARKKEKKKRKEKKITKVAKNVDDNNVVTPILMKNPTNTTTAATNSSSSSEMKSIKNNGGKSIMKGIKKQPTAHATGSSNTANLGTIGTGNS